MPPRPANRDVLEPASPNAEPGILGREDEVQDRARNLISVPGDEPQRGIEIGLREPTHVVCLGAQGVVAMIPKGLRVRVPDRPMILGQYRSKFESGR